MCAFRPAGTVLACLEEAIVPRVVGRTQGVEAIWQDLYATMTYGRGGIATMAMSALDIALWDAVGKRANPAPACHFRSHPAYGSAASAAPAATG